VWPAAAGSGHRAGDGGAVDPVERRQRLVGQLGAQADQRDQHPVGQYQPLARPGTRRAPTRVATSLPQGALVDGDPWAGELGGQVGEVVPGDPGEDRMGEGRTGPCWRGHLRMITPAALAMPAATLTGRRSAWKRATVRRASTAPGCGPTVRGSACVRAVPAGTPAHGDPPRRAGVPDRPASQRARQGAGAPPVGRGPSDRAALCGRGVRRPGRVVDLRAWGLRHRRPHHRGRASAGGPAWRRLDSSGGGDTVPVVAPVAAYRAAARLRGDVRRPADEQRFSGPGRGAPAARSCGSPGP
jgi:hypothetical protein